MQAWADDAGASNRPNILFAIADDWSYGHAGAYGCSWVETPSFDRLAEGGILFRNAYTPNAKCAPSRAIILTGRYSWQLEAAANHWCYFPPKYGGFVERLVGDGYSAGFTGKGWAPGIAQGRQLTGKPYQKRKLDPPASGITAVDYASNFADFLSDTPNDKPWVFWYGAFEPHRGYEFKSGVRFGKRLTDIERVPGYWPDNETSRHDMLDYAVEVEHFDTHLGRIIEQLEEAGQLDNTLIVATSDHGMPFPRVKGQAYDHSNHIPMAIHWPKGIDSPGRVEERFVNFADLAPTVLEAAGIEEASPLMQPISGHSLFDILTATDRGVSRDHVLIGKERHDVGRPDDVGYPIRGIRQGDWLYLHNFKQDRWPAGNPETGYLNCDGGPTKTIILEMRRSGGDEEYWDLCFGKRPEEELYDLHADPDCLHNLADSPEWSDQMKELRDRMESELIEQGDPRLCGEGDIFDQYPYADEKSRNFYDRYMNGEKLRAGWVNPSDFEKEPVTQMKGEKK
ncbi:MAG: sulfatase [Candidatus Omnitrophica bacterium]|nr:sulfatase [Candidatus Omnitrophota bacterium]